MHSQARSHARRPPRGLLAAAVFLSVMGGVWSPQPVAARSSDRPPLLCRGSTRAHVKIHWPSTADQAITRQLRWGAHLPPNIRRWGYLILPQARADGVDPFLVAGVMRVESNGDPLAWNLDSDARGFMQVLHASFEPATNLRIAVSMLASLVHRFVRVDLALAAYNAGPGAVQQYGGIPPYPETQSYVIMVTYWRDRYAGVHLSAEREARYRKAVAEAEAYYRRICPHHR